MGRPLNSNALNKPATSPSPDLADLVNDNVLYHAQRREGRFRNRV
jgi:hypothetical protein